MTEKTAKTKAKAKTAVAVDPTGTPTSADLAEVLADTVEATPKVTPTVAVKGISEEQYTEVKNIVKSGFEAGQETDTIKSAMFAAGIPFSALTRAYTAAATQLGFLKTVQEVKAQVEAAMATVTFTFEETYEELAASMSALVAAYDGLTPQKVLSAFKAAFVASDKTFPAKVKVARSAQTGTLVGVNAAMVGCFNENKTPTYDEFFAAIRKSTKDDKNAHRYAKGSYRVMFAVANGCTAENVGKAISEIPAKVEAPVVD